MRPVFFNAARLVGISVVVLLVSHLILATYRIDEVGITSDETAHLTAGYSYWKFGDYRLQPENGNLPQRWGALPLLLIQPRLDPETHAELWRQSNVWDISDDFLFRFGNDSERLVWSGRMMMVFWPIVLGLLVFIWSRKLWGNGGALFSLSLYVFSPTVLAHGPLITSDTTAAVCLLAAIGAFWQALQGRARWTVLSMVATGLAFVAKFSCVLLIPMFLVLGIWHALQTTDAKTRRSRAGHFARLLALNATSAFAVIWLSFGIRYSADAPGMPSLDQFSIPWDTLLSSPGVVTEVIRFALEWRLLPEAYIEGFCHVRHFGSARSAFLLGDYSNTGWWWFFPAAFLWKSTTAELVVTVLVASFGLARIRRHGTAVRQRIAPFAPLMVFVVIFGGFSLASSLNIGQRHILPLYPALFILCGGLVCWLQPTVRPALIALPLMSLGAALSVAPHYLTFFNLPSGGPKKGWHKLVDSSLDWGQGLPSLRTWVDANRRPGELLYVSYFGNDSLSAYLPDAIPLSPIYDHYRPREFVELQPGLYCIGATMMQDVFSPVKGPWDARKEDSYRKGMAWAREQLKSNLIENRIENFGEYGTSQLWQVDRLRFARLLLYLRIRKPDAIVANTTLVFRLSELEVQAMVDGSPEIVSLFLSAAASGEILGRDELKKP